MEEFVASYNEVVDGAAESMGSLFEWDDIEKAWTLRADKARIYAEA